MGTFTTRTRSALAAASLAGILTLTGCGDGGSSPSPGSDGSSSATPSPTPTAQSAAELNAYKPPASAKLDWWPKHQEKMATGQTFPADYEPATLDHPAKNVPKPVMPKKASEETEEGAQAFLDYYGEAAWYAYQTGDTSPLESVTFSGCEECTKEIDSIQNVYSRGAWGVGGLDSLNIHEGTLSKTPAGLYIAAVDVDSSGTILVEDNKAKRTVRPYKDSGHMDVNLRYRNGAWEYITASPRGA